MGKLDNHSILLKIYQEQQEIKEQLKAIPEMQEQLKAIPEMKEELRRISGSVARIEEIGRASCRERV